MSTTNKGPLGIRRLFEIGLVAGLVCSIITLLASCSKEDQRTTNDKEGRFLPNMCLRNIAYAMHQYHDKHGRLPPGAVYGERGVPLLSWRVLLLPYLEHDDLFRQFKLDEPWDSPHNIQLLPKMPWVYCPISPLDGNPQLEPNTTPFQVFVGKGTAFEGREGLRLEEDFPRRSYTVLIVETASSVPWTKPEDIAYDVDQPLPKLGCFFKGYFCAAMVDGTASGIHNVNEKTLRAAILRNGEGPLLWKDND